MTLISIIVPHYNEWDYLNELLKTIPSIPIIEVIVVDDNSKDEHKMFEKLQEKFPDTTFLKNISDIPGAGSARNIGLQHAKGEWLLFADSDDLFVNNFFENIEEYLSSHYDLIYFTPSSFIENTQQVSNRHRQYEIYISNYLSNKSKYNELKLRYYYLVPWSKLIRHSIVKNNQIQFEEIMVSNDILFSAKIGFYAEKIGASKKIIYKVRQNKGSLTNNINEENFRIRFQAWTDYILFIKNNIDKDNYEILNISALPQLYQVYKNNLGIRNVFWVLRKCQEMRIPILDKRLINPYFIVKFIIN